MIKKYLRIIVLCLVLTLVVVSCMACSRDCEKDGHDFVDGVCSVCGEEESKTPLVVVIELSSSAISLDINDSATLKILGEHEGPFTWASSNSAVATVDQNGVVTAHSAGNCDITVTSSKCKGSCIVGVTNSYIAPTLTVSNNNVELLVGGEYMVSPTLKYKGVDYTNSVTFEYYLADGSAMDVLSMTAESGGQKFTALKEGTASYIVYAEYAGVPLSQEITFVVNKADVFFSSSNLVPTANGYTCSLDTLENNVIVPSITVIENGVQNENAEIVYESKNASIAKVLDDGSIQSVGPGTTTITGTYQGHTFTFDVSVIKTERNIAVPNTAPLEVGRLQAVEFDGEILGSYIGAYIEGISVGASFQDGKLTLNKSSLEKLSAVQMGKNVALDFETDKVIYHTTIDLYTLVIKSEADYRMMGELSKSACADNSALWGGHFILGNSFVVTGGMDEFINIESAGNAASIAKDGTTGFCGIFDGNGYVIDGLSRMGNTSNAFLTVMHENGIIKNVGFTNVVFASSGGSFIVHAGKGTIQDVYIQYKEISNSNQNYSATIGGGNGNLSYTVNRVVVDASDTVITGNGKFFHLLTQRREFVINSGDTVCTYFAILPTDFQKATTSAPGTIALEEKDRDYSNNSVIDRGTAFIGYFALKQNATQFAKVQSWNQSIWAVDAETGKISFHNVI